MLTKSLPNNDFTIAALGRQVTIRFIRAWLKEQLVQLQRNPMLHSCAMKELLHHSGNKIIYFCFLRIPWINISIKYPHPVFHIASGMTGKNIIQEKMLTIFTYSRGFYGYPFHWLSSIFITLEWKSEIAIPQNMKGMNSKFHEQLTESNNKNSIQFLRL
jgi:hypothetical protein